MTFKQKRRINKKNGADWLFLYIRNEDLEEYDKEHCSSLDEALKKLEKTAGKMARQFGFYRREIFSAGYEDIERRIKEKWSEN